MSARNTVVRTMHDLGLAAWFGGTLMPEARGNTKVKSVVTVLGAASSVYAGVLGARIAHHAGEGAARDESENTAAGQGAESPEEGAAAEEAAEDAVAVDPFVQALVADFGGQVVAGSIRHVDSPAAA